MLSPSRPIPSYGRDEEFPHCRHTHTLTSLHYGCNDCYLDHGIVAVTFISLIITRGEVPRGQKSRSPLPGRRTNSEIIGDTLKPGVGVLSPVNH